jgi:hypothetical protein
VKRATRHFRPWAFPCLAAVCLAIAPETLRSADWHDPHDESLEILMMQASRVFRVRPKWVALETLDVRILETLKGEPAQSFRFNNPARVFPPLAEDHEFLIGTDELMERIHWVIEADREPRAPLWLMDGTRVTAPQQLLDAARKAAAYPEPAKWSVFRADLGLEARGGPLILWIPGDARAETVARAWAASAEMPYRREAAKVLARFNSPENVAVLRQLLNDPALEEQRQFRNGPREIYPVRLAAFRALRKMGVEVEQPEIDRVHWAGLFLTENAGLFASAVAVPLAIVLVYGVIRRVRKDSGKWVEPLRPGRLAFDALAIASFVLACTAAYLWAMSYRGPNALGHVDVPGNSLIIGSAKGKLIWVRAKFKLPEAAYETADWGDAGENFGDFDDLLNAPRSSVKMRFSLAGVIWLSGDAAPQDGVGRSPASVPALNEPFALRYAVQLPYWLLMTVFGLAPLLWLARQRRFARRRQRHRTGRCLDCGYDLRQTPSRCPECGTEPSPAPQTSAEQRAASSPEH